MAWEEDAYDERNGKSKLKQNLPTPASSNNGIEMDVVVVVAVRDGSFSISRLIDIIIKKPASNCEKSQAVLVTLTSSNFFR